MITENLSTLKIHKLTKEQYERELAAGRIDENALYLTPDEGADIDLSSYATVEQLNAKADSDHNHSGLYLTEEEIDAKLEAKSDFSGDYNDLSNKPTIPSIDGLATESYVNTAVDGVTADDLGIYVQDGEPANAVAGDIWVDTANDPSYIPAVLPEITEADNGKVLMVVNGRLQLVSLNLSVDANGVISI